MPSSQDNNTQNIKPVINIDAATHVTDIIARYAKQQILDYDLAFHHDGAHDDNAIILRYGNCARALECPLRLGRFLDEMDAIVAQAGQGCGATMLSFDRQASLDVMRGVFMCDHKGEIPLTEKEVEILKYLHAHRGKMIGKDVLLEQIWRYAKDVETHTLETHIYRLRQKIERDPANPEILRTQENGYCVL